MFDMKNRGKIKNNKIHHRRMALSYFSFDIIYRPGKDNVLADTFTRVLTIVTKLVNFLLLRYRCM